MNKDAAKARRTAARGWLTRAVNELNRLVNLPIDSVEVDELQDGLDDFNARLAALEEAQRDYECLLDEDTLMKDLDEAVDIIVKAKHARRVALKILKDISKGNSDDTASVQSCMMPGPIKLPQLDLPKFHGKRGEWQEFWEAFEASVHSQEISDVVKFTYLKRQVKDKAESAIKGLALTSQHYHDALKILKDRFGRREVLVFEHIQDLLELKFNNVSGIEELKELQDVIVNHVRSLEALGVEGKEYGIFLTPIILTKLPNTMRLEWARGSVGREGDLEHLLKFLKEEIQSLERSSLFDQNKVERKEVKKYVNKSKATAAVLVMDSSKPKCEFCSKINHSVHQCFKFKKLTVSERRKKVQELGLCYVCFSKSHKVFQCKEPKCKVCGGPHHELCCLTHEDKSNPEKECSGNRTDDKVEEAELLSYSCTRSSAVCTLLPTAKVKVHGVRKMFECTLLFDHGAKRSFVSQRMVRKIKPKWVGSSNFAYAQFGGGKSEAVERNLYEFDVSGLMKVTNTHTVRAFEVPTICCPVRQPTVPSDIIKKYGVQFADDYQHHPVLDIDILIGQDLIWQFMSTDVLPRTTDEYPHLVAQKSVFGWVLSGAATIPGKDRSTNSNLEPQMLVINDVSSNEVRSLWDLETLGIRPNEENLMEDPVLSRFKDSVKYCEKDKRYEVELPWKDEAVKTNLQDNHSVALKNLTRLSVKLDEEPDVKRRYDEVFEEWEKLNIIREVDEEIPHDRPVVYIPHRPVVRETSLTTKVRPVFNASKPGSNGISLNDCLHAGPNMIPLLSQVLMRFRRWNVALTADITKAFLQVKIAEKDQDCMRFLWDHNGHIRVMKFTRVPFGITSSPFLLNATIQHHLSLQNETKVIQELRENLFVDDWLSGANTVEEAKTMYEEASGIMNEASFNLTKWTSNKSLFEDKSASEEPVKILGITWYTEDDSFGFEGFDIPSDLIPTKRLVLSFLSRIFDPLGFLAPFVMVVKFLFQDLWRLGLEWDEPIPQDLSGKFLNWLRGIELLKGLRIRRCYSVDRRDWHIDDLKLYVFADASSVGYGCCVYLLLPRNDSDGFDMTLIFAKGRVAPVKPITLPRLELLACLLAVRALQFVKDALRLHKCEYSCFTDSTIALNWIKSDSNKWKQFVANRVIEIQNSTDPSRWYHISGSKNPADIVTRGITARALIDSHVWFNGPDLMCLFDCETGLLNVDVPKEEYVEEVLIHCDSHERSILPLVDISKFSSLSKALRVVALVRRCCNYFKRNIQEKNHGELKLAELKCAEKILIREAQRENFAKDIDSLKCGKCVAKSSPIYKLCPFLDQNGLLRKGSRLSQSSLSYDQIYPIILPKCHLAKLYVRFIHKLMKHPGVNQMITMMNYTFWTVGIRYIAKNVKKECFDCKRQDSKACNEIAAPLPHLRVTKASPFTVCGVDFAGPLFCVDMPETKLYVCLFTCAVTRSVHCELTCSLSTDDFILALRRMSARRGLPKTFYSDNAKTFTCADKALISRFSVLSPQWKFIAPLSPWWGGWWERLVRSIKSSLRKTIGKRCLTRVELETCIIEVEAMVNSRPLTYVSTDDGDAKPLTPNDFLLGKMAGFDAIIVEDFQNVTPELLANRMSEKDKHLEKCWQVWSNDYIRNLPTTVPMFCKKGSIQEGCMVMIREDKKIPRLQWPIGVVIKLHLGKDNLCRAADVRTVKGVITRDVRRLHNLEIKNDDYCSSVCSESKSDSNVKRIGDSEDVQGDMPSNSIVNKDSKTAKKVIVTRSGRTVRPPKKDC